MSRGYLFTPGLYEDAHVEGWRRVTDAVHGGGGTIFVQLMHAGRISDPLLLDGEPPVAPSAVAPPLAEPYDSPWPKPKKPRSEEHTSELQSLMRTSYAVF